MTDKARDRQAQREARLAKALRENLRRRKTRASRAQGSGPVLTASCHCGAVHLELLRRPAQLTDCNCSICRRLAVLWAYYKPSEVRILGGPDATAAYVWGDRTLAFHHCKVCGCTTHWEGLDKSIDRVAVNARLMDPADVEGIRVRRFDGAESWTYLD